MTEQGQALDERQSEIETLTTELQGWQEKCSLTARELEKKKEEISGVKRQALVTSDEKKRLESQMKDMSSKQESTKQNANVQLEQMEEEIRKLKQDRSCFEAQLEKKDEEIRKAHDSRENMVKTMRETFEVAKANKAEYEIKLATVRDQCRQELKREMDEELRRTKRDFQRQINEKDKSLEEIKNEKESVEKALAVEKAETSKADSSGSVKINCYFILMMYIFMSSNRGCSLYGGFTVPVCMWLGLLLRVLLFEVSLSQRIARAREQIAIFLLQANCIFNLSGVNSLSLPFKSSQPNFISVF